jgi:uncharacterized protein YjdB
MWQFGGETNYIKNPIIAGQNVDQNFAYADYPSKIKGSGLNGYPKPKPKIKYRSHLEKIGWQEWKKDGEMSGTEGEARRLEAIQIDYDKPIYAKAHIQKDGWVDYGKITKDTVIGTTKQAKRLECLCLKCEGIKYRVHIQGSGWSCWTDADGISTLGSVGQALRIEAIEIMEI